MTDKTTQLQLDQIARDVAEIKHKMEVNYVTVDQLEQVKIRMRLLEKIVYGMVSIVLVGFIAALIKLTMAQG